jgi:hypothetical protein
LAVLPAHLPVEQRASSAAILLPSPPPAPQRLRHEIAQYPCISEPAAEG